MGANLGAADGVEFNLIFRQNYTQCGAVLFGWFRLWYYRSIGAIVKVPESTSRVIPSPLNSWHSRWRPQPDPGMIQTMKAHSHWCPQSTNLSWLSAPLPLFLSLTYSCHRIEVGKIQCQLICAHSCPTIGHFAVGGRCLGGNRWGGARCRALTGAINPQPRKPPSLG